MSNRPVELKTQDDGLIRVTTIAQSWAEASHLGELLHHAMPAKSFLPVPQAPQLTEAVEALADKLDLGEAE